MTLREGLVLQNEYRLLHRRSESGQAEVWQAEDRQGRLVAVKAFLKGNPERLRRESELLRRLTYPCLPGWVDFFLTGAGPCLILDWVQGVSLEERLRSREPLSEEQKEAVLVQLAETLAFLHGQRVTHRDLKPDNVMLTPRFWSSPQQLGTVKLLDLGIAVEAGNPRPLTAEQQVGAPERTSPRLGPGTLRYMAPEMLEISPEEREGRADPRLDVFAFGVLGWVLFTGKHPTEIPPEERDPEVFRRFYQDVLRLQGSWPERPPGRFAGILPRCLQVEREKRSANGSALLALVREVFGDTTTSEEPLPPPARPPNLAPVPGPPSEPPGRTPTPTPPPAPVTPLPPSPGPPPAVSPVAPAAAPGSPQEVTLESPRLVTPGATELPGAPSGPRSTRRGVPLAAVAVVLGVLVLAGGVLMASELLSEPTGATGASSPPGVSSPRASLPVAPPAVSVGPSAGSSSPAPVTSAAPHGCPGGCGIWEVCLRGRCDPAAKHRSLVTCRIALPPGQTWAFYYDDEWLKGAPAGKLRDGFKLGSVRFHHERVLRAAVKGDGDHFLSPAVVSCE
jgi:serine/threonine protein kinase